MRVISTRDPRHACSFREALQAGTALDGGLFVPDRLPVFADIDRLLGMDFHARSTEILVRLLGDEFSREELDAVVRAAFSFPLPVVELAPGLHVLELFHGPTLAFKDVGARFLARMLSRVAGTRTVLTATSGDTGAAAAHALWGLPGLRAVVLYPGGRVTPMQEKLFATLGGNVTACAVDGSFDTCQALVKGCFADRELVSGLGLTSANSINLARILAQSLYYFEARARLDADPLFVVPSGNFGNLYSGLLARAMGLGGRFLAATNTNRVVPDHLESGVYAARRAVPTLSSAMDVGDPSNWERILHLHGGSLERVRGALACGSLDEAGTTRALGALQAMGREADPHTAVAFGVLERHAGRRRPAVILSTAHPAKFGEVLGRNSARPLPRALEEVRDRPLLSRALAPDLEALKALLEALGQEGCEADGRLSG